MIPKMFTQSLKSCSIVDSGKELCSLVFSRLPSSPLPKQRGGGDWGYCVVSEVYRPGICELNIPWLHLHWVARQVQTFPSLWRQSSLLWAHESELALLPDPAVKPPKKQLSFLVLEKQFFVRISLLASFIVDTFSSFSLVLAAIFCFRWLMVSWGKGMGICRMICSEWVLDLNSVAVWEHRVSSGPPSQHLLKTWQSVIEAWEWG